MKLLYLLAPAMLFIAGSAIHGGENTYESRGGATLHAAEYQLVWADEFEQEIRLYVNDILLNSVSLEETFNENAEGNNPLRQPHYIILNLAVGGTNGGDPAPTEFPARFEIDYVRVYQKAGAGP